LRFDEVKFVAVGAQRRELSISHGYFLKFDTFRREMLWEKVSCLRDKKMLNSASLVRSADREHFSSSACSRPDGRVALGIKRVDVVRAPCIFQSLSDLAVVQWRNENRARNRDS
jgi:hypothetical protein